MHRIRGFLFALFFLAAVAGGAFLAFWIDRKQRDTSGLPQLVQVPERLVQRESPPPRPPVAQPTPAPREPVAAEPAPEPAPTLPAIPPEVPMGTLRGRVLADDGRPLQRAVVQVLEVADGTFRLPHGDALDLAGARTAVTDAQGVFQTDWPDGQPALLLARSPGYAPSQPTPTTAGADCDLVLTPGIELHGTVTDPRGGPVAGATVRVLHPGEPVALAPWTTTAVSGAYSLAVAEHEGCVVEVVPLEGAPSDWLEIPAGDTPDRALDVVLEPGWVVEGLVRDAETSQPVGSVTVAIGSPLADLRTTTTDAGGRFVLGGLGGAASRLRASAPGYAPVELSRIPLPDDGAARVELVLERGRTLTGRVVDATGAPVPEARVDAIAARQGSTGTRSQRETATTDSEGRFRVDRLSRDLAHALLVTRPGYASSTWDLPALPREQAEHDLGDLVLRPAARLSGVVRAPDGPAIAGIEVLLEGSNRDRTALRGEQEPARVADPIGPRVVRTDAAGRFWFCDVPSGRFRMTTRRDGSAAGNGITLEVATASDLTDLQLVVDASAFVAGRVLGPDEQPMPGVTVFARAVTLEHPEAAAQLAQVRVRTDDQGRFSLTGIAAGEYVLHAQPDAAPAEDARGWMPVVQPGVRTGRDDVVLRLAPGGRVAGTLVDAGGRPLQGWLVSTSLAEGNTRTATTSAEGRFELLLPVDTPCTLEVRGAPGTPAFERVLLRQEDVRTGAGPLELQLPAPGGH